ncbi:DGQHR domain-containing protein [Brevundimonas vesicularis]|uniref:DGQHR domain-containing protein n=1 Tax=Brevundimonas vesicularis TaxID=41276 RepID=UPI0008379813|nr:DGQHR domain-containing protein [Brevundimonas vesicularis]
MAKYTYPALVYSQRGSAKTAFCMLSAPAGQILQWARVDRLEHNNLKGVQRRKNDTRTRSIKQFLTADPANTIPTALTVALPFSAINGIDGAAIGKTGVSPVSITIDVDEAEELPGLIIDGQHRIFGINEFDPQMHVSVVLLLGASDAEIAFQFLVINNKVARVSPDHMKALKLAYQLDDLDARLTRSARMKSNGAPTYLETIDTEADSPFKGRLKWPRNNDTAAFRAIPPNAFEAALLYLQQQMAVTSTDADAKGYDAVVDFFLEIWRTVQTKWPLAWTDATSRLLSKVGIVAFSQYIIDAVIARAEALDQIESLKDLDQVRQHVEKILERQTYEFWTAPWSTGSLDTEAGRGLVLKDLKRIANNDRNGKPWFDSLGLVDKLDG